MATTKIIQYSDIDDIKPISDNIDQLKRIDPYIIEAQDLDIRPFLGDALFYDFAQGLATSPQTEKYVELLNGTTYTYQGYTISFDGIKVALAYFAYARFIQNQPINITSFGVVKKLNIDYSEPVSAEILEKAVGNARSIGLAYLAQAEQFLDTECETYPLWKISNKYNPRGKIKVTSVKNY